MPPTPILFEDADILAVAKPAGVVVIPGRGEPPEQSLRAQLERQRGEQLWVVHRLDRDTSGVVLFARNEEAHRRLSMAFEHREVSKTYLAWTRSAPSPSAGTIALPLHSARKGKMRPATSGEHDALESQTDYRTQSVAETAAGPVATVEASPKTGRQHQIRVHLRAIDAPLLVDALYGRCDRIGADVLGSGSPEVPRLTLHASRIVFPGRTGTITIDCPLPPDLDALSRWLSAHR